MVCGKFPFKMTETLSVLIKVEIVMIQKLKILTILEINNTLIVREDHELGYAHLHRPALQGEGMMGSQNENDMPVRDGENYMRPANSHYIVPCDELRASTRRSDNMKLVDGHYKIPPRGRITKENASCDNMMFTD